MPKAFKEGTASVNDLMRAAIQFHHAASGAAGSSPPLALPSIVCGAFALELLLKTLIVKEGRRFPFTHKLEVLYGRLSPAGQNAVRDAWAVLVDSQHWSIVKSEIEKIGGTISDSLIENLRLSSNAFEDFRYMGAGKISAYYVGGLTKPLLESMLHDYPEFKMLVPHMDDGGHADDLVTSGSGARGSGKRDT